MISASVGFQCPDCVNAGSSTRPLVKTVKPSLWQSLPVVTRSVIAVCVGVYILAWATGLGSAEYKFGLSSVDVAQGQWWRLITATFMHAGVMHILFNMYALLVLGASLERVLGTMRFAAIYFMSALGGSVAALWFSSLDTISVGASGAIFGLMTATIVVGRTMRIDTSQIMFWLGLNVVLGFLSPGIDWRAHLGGAVAGAIAARVVTSPTSPNSRSRWLYVGLIFAVLLGLVLVRNQQILTYLGR